MATLRALIENEQPVWQTRRDVPDDASLKATGLAGGLVGAEKVT
jgi:hypothetical protein